MSACQARERAAVDRAARRLRGDCPAVAAAERARPATSPTGRWALEVLTDRAAGGLPPQAARICAAHGLTVRRIHRGHACWRALVVA